jgi:hypothetical protein
MHFILAAVSILALSTGSQALRTPVQLERLRREAIDARNARPASGARAENVVANTDFAARDTDTSKCSSTISFADPRAQGKHL